VTHLTAPTEIGALSRTLPVEGVEHRFVEVDGRRLHVAVAGQGAPLVLLHTSFEHWWAWRHVIPALAERHLMICPDMRGCGWSSAPADGYEKEALSRELVALLDALGLERVALAGHGMGGMVGFLAALHAPERFSAYLAIGTVHPWLRLDRRLVASLWRSWYQPVVAAPIAGPRTVASRRFLSWMFRGTSPNPQAWSDADIEAYGQVLDEPARARAQSLLYRTFLAGELPAIARGRYRDQRLPVPTLLLFGTRDAFLSQSALRGYEEHAERMTVELLEGEGHFVHEERPALVVEHAERFLAEAA
jgi:pimeloyl-ACP methyl ester carboxylesterase